MIAPSYEIEVQSKKHVKIIVWKTFVVDLEALEFHYHH